MAALSIVELNRAHSAQGSFGGSITGATNASPIVVTTSAATGFVAGDQVQVTGVGGNTNANALAFVNPLTPTTFQMFSDAGLSVPIAGNAAYTSGGAVSMAKDISGITTFSLLRLIVESLTAGDRILLSVQDSADGFVADIKTLWVLNPEGQVTGSQVQGSEISYTLPSYQIPSARFGVASARLRVYVQSLDSGTTANVSLIIE
jgi:hypothetical protein